MRRKRPTNPDQIEQDFLDALQRLKAGQPQNLAFRKKVGLGKSININISTVAQEADRARGLIAMENCRYPKVRQLVLMESGAPGIEPGNRDDVIASLRSQVAELRVEVKAVMSHAASHFDLRTKAERRAEDYKARYERLRSKYVNGTTLTQNKVVELFPSDPEGS